MFCTVSSLLITILQTHDKPVTVKFMFSCENDDLRIEFFWIFSRNQKPSRDFGTVRALVLRKKYHDGVLSVSGHLTQKVVS